jgi:hypothetical protein
MFPVSVKSARDSREEAPVEDTRFDHLAKVLGAQKTRRLTLGALLGGALSALGLTDPDEAWAAKSGKCRRKPGECETCKKGKCQRKNGEKKCKRGKIKPKANGTACSVGTCQSGTCVAAGGGGGGGGGGGTGPAPNCIPKGGFCLKLQGTECCSRVCQGGTVTTGTCAQSQLGEPCITNDDCRTGFPFFRFCGPNFTCEQIVINP